MCFHFRPPADEMAVNCVFHLQVRRLEARPPTASWPASSPTGSPSTLRTCTSTTVALRADTLRPVRSPHPPSTARWCLRQGGCRALTAIRYISHCIPTFTCLNHFLRNCIDMKSFGFFFHRRRLFMKNLLGSIKYLDHQGKICEIYAFLVLQHQLIHLGSATIF